MVIGWISGPHLTVDLPLGFLFLGDIIVLNVFKKTDTIANGTLEEKPNGNSRSLECFFLL